MGSMINASCECGYEKNMSLGGGMMNFNTRCNFPFYCEGCNILFEDNIFNEKIICPNCHKGDIYSYDTAKACGSVGEKTVFDWNVGNEIGRKLLLTDGDYICPSCHKFSLRFEDVGCWD